MNVALPSIQSGLHASRAAVQLIIAGYGLTFATGMITGGRLGDLYGRRRMFMTGLALFTLTSAACGLAPTAGLLIGARVLQGAAGALMTPQVLAIIGTVYTGPRRDRAFAAYGLAMGFAGVLGQLLGGAIIAASVGGSGWRGIFLINVPVGVVALRLARRVLPEFRGNTARLDLASGHRLPQAVEAVILMADTLVLGPSSQVHVSMPDLRQPVVLFRQKGGIGIRHAGPFTVDGQRFQERGQLGPSSRAVGEEFSLAIEPVGVKGLMTNDYA